jgi:hypothetical protein
MGRIGSGLRSQGRNPSHNLGMSEIYVTNQMMTEAFSNPRSKVNRIRHMLRVPHIFPEIRRLTRTSYDLLLGPRQQEKAVDRDKRGHFREDAGQNNNTKSFSIFTCASPLSSIWSDLICVV